MEYNVKISTTGDYLNFHGWSIVSMLDNDLKFLENYIKNHHILKKYFSALPSNSFHMTVYNLWCNGNPLLNHQQRFIKQNFNENNVLMLEKESQKYGVHFNPSGCINELLFKLHFICNNHNYKKIKVIIKDIKYNGNTIRISLDHTNSKFEIINRCRNNLIHVCERNDNMGGYHITLAYKYKDIDSNTLELINNEINNLNILLKNQTITLQNPSVKYFSNMTNFTSFIQSI